jgi:hypothetical protein
MPDITMCKGTDCPLKETCYRYTATPSLLQSIYIDVPLKEDGTCEHYWKIESPTSKQKTKTITNDNYP